MHVGIIAEGKADCAVITNILAAKIGIDRSDITYIRPNLFNDETDLAKKTGKFAAMGQEEFGSWTLVREECQKRDNFIKFFDLIDEERIMIVHLDTDVCEEYGVEKPNKKTTESYEEVLRNLVIEKINSWLDNNHTDRIKYAVSIEQIDAWVLCIYLNSKNTSEFIDAKKRLHKELNRIATKKDRRFFLLDEFDKYLNWSSEFSKKSRLTKLANKNKSLELFCNSFNNSNALE